MRNFSSIRPISRQTFLRVFKSYKGSISFICDGREFVSSFAFTFHKRVYACIGWYSGFEIYRSFGHGWNLLDVLDYLNEFQIEDGS